MADFASETRKGSMIHSRQSDLVCWCAEISILESIEDIYWARSSSRRSSYIRSGLRTFRPRATSLRMICLSIRLAKVSFAATLWLYMGPSLASIQRWDTPMSSVHTFVPDLSRIHTSRDFKMLPARSTP